MRYCRFDGCNNKIAVGAYCEEHQRSKKSKRSKIKQKSIYHHVNKSFYNSDPWKSLSAFVYERENGHCQRCGKFVFGRRAHRHHIKPVKDYPDLKLEPNNIRLLCPECHIIEENEDKPKKVYPSYFD